MVDEHFVQNYWKAVAEQDKNRLREFFDPQAEINWHDSNDRFSLEGFLSANCEYPGSWVAVIERIEFLSDEKVITVVKVSSDDGQAARAVSFFKFFENKIVLLDEYWGTLHN